MKINIKPILVNPVVAEKSHATGIFILDTRVKNYGDAGFAEVSWALVDDNEQYLLFGQTELKGADYAGWGSDDEYLSNWLLGKLGLEEA